MALAVGGEAFAAGRAESTVGKRLFGYRGLGSVGCAGAIAVGKRLGPGALGRELGRQA